MAAGTGRKRSVSVRGRTAVALGLVAVLVVTSSVTWRRARGNLAATRLDSLRAVHDELQAQRSRLEGDVRRAASQVELVPRAERLGLRLPGDQQVIDLPAIKR